MRASFLQRPTTHELHHFQAHLTAFKHRSSSTPSSAAPPSSALANHMSIRQLTTSKRHSRAAVETLFHRALSTSGISHKNLSIDCFDEPAIQLLRRTPSPDARSALESFCAAIAQDRVLENVSFLCTLTLPLT